MTYKEMMQDIRRRNTNFSNDVLSKKIGYEVYDRNITEPTRSNKNKIEDTDENVKDITDTENPSNSSFKINIPSGTKTKILDMVELSSDTDINLNIKLLNGDKNNIAKYIMDLFKKQ